MNPLPMSWWIVAALCGVGYAALWWWVRERPRAARTRAMKRQLDACGPAESPVEQVALDSLRDSPRKTGRTGTDASAPRFMFLGDASALLSTASAARPADASASFWQWRELPSMTAIAIHPQVIAAPDAPTVRRAWGHALLALMQARRRLPLNGIVVCLDARHLQEDGDALHSEVARLRRLIDEAAFHLRLRLPIYLVVTGLEQLHGYDRVRSSLSGEVLAQVLGHRIDEGQPSQVRDAFDGITQRLHGLRMALLRRHSVAPDRMAIHDFVEAVRSLRAGLDAAATLLCANSENGSRAQPWRGLYLTAADPTGDAFIHDLLTRLLPADHLLARPA